MRRVPDYVAKNVAKIAIKNSDIRVLENLIKKGYLEIVKKQLKKSGF